jgi:glyoxalase family protein
MQLNGLHHLTAVTANAAKNYAFYTNVLGMRLVKKTVNQDDVSAYHLFYADGQATPGTDLTFFDWPVSQERRGTRSITRTGLRVCSPTALDYWNNRLTDLRVPHDPIREIDARRQILFEDPEGQRLALVDDGAIGPAHPWDASPVTAAYQIRGLGPVTISVPALAPSDRFLTEVMAMRAVRTYPAELSGVTTHVYAMAEGGPAAELHVEVDPSSQPADPGAGGAHHVAFRIPDADYGAWVERFDRLGVRSSGPVDRFYFRSLYAREPGGVLYEIATDGPGFATDEPMELLGERLSLPPFLEPQRASIERDLKPLVTTGRTSG